MDNKKWFKEAKMGLMIHWGLYSILGGEWNGQRIKTIGEWAMHRFQINIKEYELLADIFNPINCILQYQIGNHIFPSLSNILYNKFLFLSKIKGTCFIQVPHTSEYHDESFVAGWRS